MSQRRNRRRRYRRRSCLLHSTRCRASLCAGR
ncbi:MAG: hypothetical protein GY944_13265 [bacterium]|nr:hypothetical protein [bacterium]